MRGIYRSLLQCVAVCCSVLQCVAVCCSVCCRQVDAQNIQVIVAVCCSVLQCIAVCCSACCRQVNARHIQGSCHNIQGSVHQIYRALFTTHELVGASGTTDTSRLVAVCCSVLQHVAVSCRV